MANTSSKSSRVSFASVTTNNLGTVRKLNSVLFPIKYSEKFYQGILLPEVEDFCKLAAHSKPKISKIYLHVQVSNTDAKKFYERHGFKEVGVHADYYKKISPHDAWILEKTFS
ncbi:hypothetical protein DXG03_003235 [Asterophora parasitica]|uniref:N-acetyltransferase domain-containing protein n=1 Tax=Asterophora parasitica TaxID=117018 RepID=A0A9P7GDN2_9AGAR|nr:hypothetical protein DXG03_003235 [Asterophora parasitica]